MELQALGWNASYEQDFADYQKLGWQPGRVFADHAACCHVHTADGPLLAQLPGALLRQPRHERPVTGDWLGIERTGGGVRVRVVLPRRSLVTRKVAGRATQAQLVAANVDWLMLVCGLDGEVNPRRLERLLVLAWESGARPVVLLNKLDLCDDLEAQRRCVEELVAGSPVLAVSGARGEGLEALSPYLSEGQTSAFVGSSGVGKSTILNRLLGEERLSTGRVRAGDGKGRHTTSRRELLLLPAGGLVIDTPGLREIALWESEGGLPEAFADIERLAAGCAFRDCRHTSEPGCAVRAAAGGQGLATERLASYLKLQSELAHVATKRDQLARLAQKRKWKAIHKEARRLRSRHH